MECVCVLLIYYNVVCDRVGGYCTERLCYDVCSFEFSACRVRRSNIVFFYIYLAFSSRIEFCVSEIILQMVRILMFYYFCLCEFFCDKKTRLFQRKFYHWKKICIWYEFIIFKNIIIGYQLALKIYVKFSLRIVQNFWTNNTIKNFACKIYKTHFRYSINFHTK